MIRTGRNPAPPHREPTKASEPALNVEPLTLPLPVAPWDMPRPPTTPPAHRTAGRPVDARLTSSAAAVEPTRASGPLPSTPVESTKASCPPSSPVSSTRASSSPPSTPASSTIHPEPAPASGQSTQGQEDLTQLSEMVGNLVNLLGDVIGDVVGDALAENSRRVEQRHAQEQENLARAIEAAMDRQEVRFRAALEQQAQAFAAVLDRHVEVQAESLKTILREVLHDRPTTSVDDEPAPTTAEALQELQETLRLGFGEVRTALDRHHRELMEVVRVELRPLAKAALTHLTIASPGAPSSDISVAASAALVRAPPGERTTGRAAAAPNTCVGPENIDDAEPERSVERSRSGSERHHSNAPADADDLRLSQELSQ